MSKSSVLDYIMRPTIEQRISGPTGTPTHGGTSEGLGKGHRASETAIMTTCLEDGSRRQYQHETFRDAGAQVRLLEKVIPDENDDIPSYTLTTWDFATVPEYTAISYTWGTDFGNCFIRLNEHSFSVGDNCYWALKRAHGRSKYLWIDSISINQENLDEKSSQVAMMGDIYQRASFVLAYIGEDADNAAMVFSVLDQLDEFLSSLGKAELQDYDEERDRKLHDIFVAQWEAQNRSVSISQLYRRFALACYDVGERRYWQRIWIVQELWLAREVTILCGDIAVRMSRITPVLQSCHDWMDMMYRGEPSRSFQTTMLRLLEEIASAGDNEGNSHLHDITAFWGSTMPEQCSDYRDRVYALLKLVQWDGPQLHADYTVEKLEFVLRLVRCCGRSGVYPGFEFYTKLSGFLDSIEFHLDSTPHILRFLRGRKAHASEPKALSVESSPAALKFEDQFPRACRLELGTGGMAIRGDSPDKKLQHTFHQSFPDAMAGSHRILDDDRYVIYVNGAARSGDLLIQPSIISRVWLVGRNTRGSDMIDLTGYAITFGIGEHKARGPVDWSSVVIKNSPLDVVDTTEHNCDLYMAAGDLVMLLLLDRAVRTRDLDLDLCEVVLNMFPSVPAAGSYGILKRATYGDGWMVDQPDVFLEWYRAHYGLRRRELV